MPLISNCSMMPAWHQLVSMSGHVEESETARKLQLYATSIYQVHSFVCQLDYNTITQNQNLTLPVQDVTRQQYEILILGPKPIYDEIIKSFVSFQLIKFC